MIVGSNDDGRADAQRCTEDGINVVALGGHGLHRARPERPLPTFHRRAIEPQRSSPPLLVAALVLVALALALALAPSLR